MGKVFSGGFATGPAPVSYDGGTASGARTSIQLNGGTGEVAAAQPAPSVPAILSRIVYKNDCQYITNAADPLLIDSITFNDNALAKAVTEHMLANVEGSQPFLYATQNHADGIYVRRHDHMLPGIDLSCISPWNSANGVFRGGTAITRQHVAIATHYPIGVGATIRFVSMTNEVVDRTITARTKAAVDISIVTLNEPLPTSIKPALVMPEDWRDYLGESKYTTTGVFITDRQDRLIPARWYDGGGIIENDIRYDISGFGSSRYASMASRFIPPTSGDSGNSVFMVMGSHVVFLASVHTPAGGEGIYDAMPQVLPIIGSTPLNVISLSGLTKYA